ncbi:MAG: hypothetical protein J5592_06850, partial [Clostridia bacterium]|nr:hypothetical protein [Clostridia bacterium]
MGGMGKEKTEATTMSDFEYVPKERWKPERDNLEKNIHNVQDRVRDYFTFSYHFVGSGSNGLIRQVLLNAQNVKQELIH